MNNNGKLEWFNGNQAALDLYRMFVDVAHVWDDLIDRDKPVSNEQISEVFTYMLVTIPSNPVWREHFVALQPLLINAISSYMVANKYENMKDAHGIELAHTLRYSVANVFIYIINVMNGFPKAQEILPEALKEMYRERWEDYKKGLEVCEQTT